MFISVVISTYNRPEILYRTLYSLYRQGDKESEILVSIDDDPEILPLSEQVCCDLIALGANIRYFNTGQYKRGVGWSLDTYPMNVGIRQEQGEIVVINTGDVMSITNTIPIHREFYSNHPENAVLCSTIHALTLEIQNDIDRYPWKANPDALLFKGSCYKMFSGKGISYTRDHPTEDAAVPYYWQMSLRKQHLVDIRGLDEDYYGQIGGCADDDLADRLRRKGLQFYYSVDAVAIHQHHLSGELITKHGSSEKQGMSGQYLFKQRKTQSIVRNPNHEWGQYPRDMTKLVPLSQVT